MKQKIVALPGDGIGPEVVDSALRILSVLQAEFGWRLEVEVLPLGGAAIRRHGLPLPDFVLEACRGAAAVLLGAVGDPSFDGEPPDRRPEKALLTLRRELNLFANLRPVRVHDALTDSSPLRPEIIRGVDLLFVRELTGGIYFGRPRGLETRDRVRTGFNTEIYHDWEIERIARVAFEAARRRRGAVASVDKSNVLESSQLWRAVVDEISVDYPDVRLRHILVDNCAMQLIADPRQFDVILTSNMFGDILSDEAAMLTGSIGMLPSASLGDESGGLRRGLYEPVHGSAPDIAGRGVANPLAAIASLAMLLRHSLGESEAADRIDRAVGKTLLDGVFPADLAQVGPGADTRRVTDSVTAALGPAQE